MCRHRRKKKGIQKIYKEPSILNTAISATISFFFDLTAYTNTNVRSYTHTHTHTHDTLPVD